MTRKFNAKTDIGDLKGRVVLVTGGNAGLGAATVRALAEHNPACIYLCARRIAAGEEVAKAVEASTKTKVHVLELDLASFPSIRSCAATFNQEADRLDLLFLNAGISGLGPGLTKEGYEQQFGVNHVGHALLTQLLLPKMLHTVSQDPTHPADVRIVVTASMIAHSLAPKGGVVLSEVRNPDFPSHTLGRYAQSKLANILFARKLAQLYPSITVASVHPGTVKSDLWGKANGAPIGTALLRPFVWLTGVTSDEGAKTLLWCATADRVSSGAYYDPPGKDRSAQSKAAVDQKLTDKLWQWTTEELAKHEATSWPKV